MTDYSVAVIWLKPIDRVNLTSSSSSENYDLIVPVPVPVKFPKQLWSVHSWLSTLWPSMAVHVQRGSSPWTFASSRRTGEWLGTGSSASFCLDAERSPVEFLNLVQSCSTLCCPVGACVLALVIRVLPSLFVVSLKTLFLLNEIRVERRRLKKKNKFLWFC